MSAKWTAIAWTRHSTTSVVVDDPAFITGRRVVAECENEDEARLIAAAPALLAACRVALDQTCPDGRAKDWKQLRDAIAKATGPAG
jgi:hypothetical protein